MISIPLSTISTLSVSLLISFNYNKNISVHFKIYRNYNLLESKLHTFLPKISDTQKEAVF